jgi:hypothetical protein
MSQEKVNKYKEEKANRKKNLRKEKLQHRMRQVVAGAVVLVLVGWLGYSVYEKYDSSRPQQTAEVNFDAINEYQENLMSTAEAE